MPMSSIKDCVGEIVDVKWKKNDTFQAEILKISRK